MIIIIIIVIIVIKYLKTFTKSESGPSTSPFHCAFSDARSITRARVNFRVDEIRDNTGRCKSTREREKKKRVTGPGYCERKQRGTISTHHRQSGRCS